MTLDVYITRYFELNLKQIDKANWWTQVVLLPTMTYNLYLNVYPLPFLLSNGHLAFGILIQVYFRSWEYRFNESCYKGHVVNVVRMIDLCCNCSCLSVRLLSGKTIGFCCVLHRNKFEVIYTQYQRVQEFIVVWWGQFDAP